MPATPAPVRPALQQIMTGAARRCSARHGRIDGRQRVLDQGRHIAARLQLGHLQSADKALHAGAAVAFHHHPVQAHQAGAVVTLRVHAPFQAAQQRQGEQAAELAQQRAVYALDLPGHGQSSKDVGDGSLEMLIGTLHDWLDVLGLPCVHLVGHSLGGAVALGMALQNPDRVRSCTLIASAALGPEIDAGYIDGVVEANRRKQLKPCLERLFADPGRMTRQLVDELLKFKRLDGVRDALAANNHLLDYHPVLPMAETA